jgi:hypothetical protein
MFIPLVHTIQNIFYKQQSEKNPSHLVVRMSTRYEIINGLENIEEAIKRDNPKKLAT